MGKKQFYPVAFDKNILFVTLKKFNSELKSTGTSKNTRILYIVSYYILYGVISLLVLIALAYILQIVIKIFS